MSNLCAIRHPIHASQSRLFTAEELRKNYLVENVFTSGQVNLVYTLYDRFIVGGAQPTSNGLSLNPPEILKADFFLQRRELGVINIGDTGVIEVDGQPFEIGNKEALYIGRGSRDVLFKQGPSGSQPLFYFNSAPAHHAFPSKKVSLDQAETVELGSPENSNHRTIRKLLIAGVIETCQLQMGLTELKPGSVWNTMPAHTHDRRMEVYLYFNVPTGQTVCHFMGEPLETRHIWVQNQQAVISPPWSIHAGAGTSNYSFIWGMAGENLDYSDMDIVQPANLR
ncbi:MAG: 5-dehydro-4-deoxy-D-glucuronate isomerase [Cyclobacteriaceae bacterium]|nr:5-dehydro-4-deoxy-D-glucuronate isomerase [Cyclobacteriaceae bacterium]UYN85783.1 MAG: 5-dehydro-4-deoxy-D-glucuronate isomerase [Cyclobacteriaceae bacterium]